MSIRLALALTTAATLWLSPTPAQAAAADIELISDPDFQSIHDRPAAAPWRCDDTTESVDDAGPEIGAEFTQLIGERDGDIPGMVPPSPIEAPHQLSGGPTADSPAACTQVVPVQPGGTYRLEMRMQGGPVTLATEYGSVSSLGSAHWETLTTTFTVRPHKRTVKVMVHGVRGAEPYYASDLSMVGPASAVQRPAAPTALRTDRRTSRTLRLSWRAAPGATGYRVLRNGRSLLTTTETSALIPDLTAATSARLTVRALNPGGQSPQSAAVTVRPLPIFTAAPDRPTDVVVSQGRWGRTLVELTAPARVTDGYNVYLDGHLAGWMCEAPAALQDVPDGPHVITVTALNAVGASAPSNPASVVVGEAE